MTALCLTVACLLFPVQPFDEVTVRTGLDSDQLISLASTLPAEHRIISDLTISLGGGEILFDVEIRPNPDDAPWLSLFNVTGARFRRAEKSYSGQGYRLLLHESVTVDRRTYHSAVWVQDDAEQRGMEIPDEPLPESGRTCDALAPLDALMRSFLHDNSLPGATLAVSYQGRLVYARGFGFADLRAREAMQPESIMRIASISKPITAVATLQLVQSGQLHLDDLALDWLLRRDDLDQAAEPADERWRSITIRHLLDHSGGWDRDISPDPMFRGTQIQSDLQLTAPPEAIDYVRYQLTQPLDFSPGTRTAYSNFGYCVLGRIIEACTGNSYNQYVADSVLAPAGMQHTFPGRTRAQQRRTGEVIYHTQRRKPRIPFWQQSIVRGGRGVPQLVDRPYGHWHLEVMDAHGGWISSAPDLLRFLHQLESASQPLLNSESRRLMLQPPEFADSLVWYSCGWNVRPAANGGHTFWHMGRLAGTSTLLVRRHDGWSWAVLFNCDQCGDSENAALKIDPLVHRAIARIDDIPDGDLFTESASAESDRESSSRNENRTRLP